VQILIKRTVHLFFIVFFGSSVCAQDGLLPLYVVYTDHPDQGSVLINRSAIPDSNLVVPELYDLLKERFQEGYLAASVDSISYDSTRISACMYLGPRYEWAVLSFDSIDGHILRKARINKNKFRDSGISPEELVSVQRRIVTVCENNGYPFASVRIRDLSFDDQQFSGEMILDRGPMIVIDTVIVKGSAKISSHYIEKQIGIGKGDLYNQRQLDEITSRIDETSFLKEIKPSEIEFYESRADVYTYLEKARANQFIGIVGILPNHGKTGKLLLTGDLNLLLLNSFGRGESMYVHWKKLEPYSQELNINSAYPYLFSSSVGLGARLHLLKQDTSYVTVNPELEFRFFLKGSDYFRIFYEMQTNRSLISRDEELTYLPPFSDLNTALYGLGLNISRLDYMFNPRRGVMARADLALGSKKIRKISNVNDAAYQDVDLNSTQFQVETEVSVFFPLGARWAIHTRNMSGHIQNQRLFENELFRLGGIHNIRGVDENSIYASSYTLGTLEVRFLFERSSNLYLFFDGGYYRKEIPEDRLDDTPISFGAGINLQTRAGIFTINYAVGRQFGNPVNIGNAKVHLGYVNRF
jgi:outer membrane protein assembly factor BamA